MWRSIGIVLIAVFAAAPAAWGHEPLPDHEGAASLAHFSDVLAGVALILSAASLWLSVRTHRRCNCASDRAAS